MTETLTVVEPPMAARNHIALHLAHRWFAFFEAPGGDLDAHLEMFHPQVRLSSNRGNHVFARDHASLIDWFAAIPDAVSSHHIVHSNYSTANNGDGLLNMVVAYQAPGNPGMHGSIISYETRVEFASGTARFSSLDKTPILPNKRLEYETSWSNNRVLSWVHAELGGITESSGQLRAVLGNDVQQVSAQSNAPEGQGAYSAIVTSIGGNPVDVRAVHLEFTDNVRAIMPTAMKVVRLAGKGR
jgi:hypothetical protein